MSLGYSVHSEKCIHNYSYILNLTFRISYDRGGYPWVVGGNQNTWRNSTHPGRKVQTPDSGLDWESIFSFNQLYYRQS